MIIFEPWRRFSAVVDERAINRFFRNVATESKKAFRQGVKEPPKTGRIYRKKGGRVHQASVNRARAEFPANDTGRLLRSIDSTYTPNSATVGSNAPYSGYLADGTIKMKRRKMSRAALDIGVRRSRGSLREWVRWKQR